MMETLSIPRVLWGITLWVVLWGMSIFWRLCVHLVRKWTRFD